MLEAFINEPMGLCELDWCSRAVPVLKNAGSSARLVTDFKAINIRMKRPTHATDISNHLLR